MNGIKSAIGIFENFADEYLNFEKTPTKNIFWLDTMNFICNRLHNPHNSCPAFHVAGSKGKGSISKMIACILDEAGFFTGIYSSPHIINFIERIGTVNGPFDESVYEKSVKQLIENISSIKAQELSGCRPITWFELVTLLGMLCFKNAKTDYAVYEVGLGGRLDATNVINPCCCCISQIELEHTEFLGDTLEQIAKEKGGIIKKGVPVIVAPQNESVKKVFKDIANKVNAPIVFLDESSIISNIVYKSSQLTYNNSYNVYKNAQKKVRLCFSVKSNLFKRPLNLSLSMLGDFQAKNATLAAIAVKTVLPNIDESIIEKGLAKATLPGRFELVELNSQFVNIQHLILDGAHTVKSIGFTLDTFRTLFPKKQDTVNYLLFACASDKDVEDIAPLFKDKFDHIILTIPGETKSSDFPRLKAAFNSANIEYTAIPNYIRAISYVLTKADEEYATVLVTGSFYLVAEVKKYLIGLKAG